MVPPRSLPHDDLGKELVAITALLLTLSAAFLFTRLYLKIDQRRCLWWDDYILVVAWLLFLVGSALGFRAVGLGYGRHVYDMAPATLAGVIAYGAAAGTFNLVASALSKTSFALTLLRLPVGRMKYFLWFIVITMNVLINTSAASLWFPCPQQPSQPNVRRAPASQQRWCLDGHLIISYSQFAGAFSAATDITLAILPWKILWNLQMNATEKTGALFAMSMGVFAGLASAVRTTRIAAIDSLDLINGVGLVAWGMAEVAVTIMAASTPILRALFPRPKEARPVSEDGRQWGQIRRDRVANEPIPLSSLGRPQNAA